VTGRRGDATPRARRVAGGGLLWKYLVTMAGIVSATSLAIGLTAIWISYHHHRDALIQIQREQTDAAAAKIGQFVKEIERQVGWLVQVPWAATTLEERRIDAIRLLRQVPAITELTVLDDLGREQLRISRLAVDIIGSGIDRSGEPLFLEARADRVFYGPVYLNRDSEPFMTLALAGVRRDAGVVVASVNLKFIWDVVSQIKVATGGVAYVVNAEGRLIAHPDISLVLRNTDFAHLPQVRATRGDAGSQGTAADARDLDGRAVFATHAMVPPLGWTVFVEVPAAEAFAPIYASLLGMGVVLLAALVLAIIVSVVLARRMVTPIRALEGGAVRIGAGALDHRIDIRTGDELQALGEQFNSMAAQLQDSYATLERKVVERTHQLELANLAKSRFLAAASHDLRQPLHALNLFIAQLRSEPDKVEQGRLVARIDAAGSTMKELFDALLDISRLDAGVLVPSISEFPVARLLKRIETTFLAAAREKQLHLRVVPSSAWIRSDFILLERVLLNLVSNAVRYTDRGGIVIGCRRGDGHLRLEVCDSGIGIPEERRTEIFGEFYQLAEPGREHRGGVGLGLAIVDRLCRLLDHPIALATRLDRGSRFSITVPLAQVRAEIAPASLHPALAGFDGKLVVVIDDDAMVRDAMQGLLRSWGCLTITAESENDALAGLAMAARAPDLLISDYRLGHGLSGFDLIDRFKRRFGAGLPAFLISGDTAPERLREAQASGYRLLHKPVSPVTLRAIVGSLLKENAASDAPSPRNPAIGLAPPTSPSPAPLPQ
jgi:signal transduction histidine kinase/DNA-binding NarL/FixJ family response regulator